ncbi:MAG: class I SAM-dependent methyltransferase [Nitrospirae bacterium]|nr:class I SAM-dependent methyltransferase [Nitrospirota bacterium]MBF0520503.1 class I SAM-dependent methyltransferase [Nitrospirota bacterium]MBF0535784.1 class I SAM-dependent methyltransferase [Nitrospirota bacterium]MBF0617675.1 class I SAM-dependent methyltransferase [Nitrospirota bacterium]
MSENDRTQKEMSRYIDLEIYHRVEKTHPFYIEMAQEIITQISNYCKDDKKYEILELGAGTGLLTMELLGLPFCNVHALELDSDCCYALRRHITHENCIIVNGDAVNYCKSRHFDVVVSSFAHDHICYDKAADFAKNIRNNLLKGGIYVMGGEILPYYETSAERREALYKYHGYIINKALRDGFFEVAQIEINALKSGLEMIGDFKRHEAMFEKEMTDAGFTLLMKRKIGPLETHDVGGVFVYVYGN